MKPDRRSSKLLKTALWFSYKEQGFEQAKHMSQVWSSSFFRQKNRVQSADATYFHCVVRVSDKNLRAVLRLSGSVGIHLVPKGPDRSRMIVSGSFRSPGR